MFNSKFYKVVDMVLDKAVKELINEDEVDTKYFDGKKCYDALQVHYIIKPFKNSKFVGHTNCNARLETLIELLSDDVEIMVYRYNEEDLRDKPIVKTLKVKELKATMFYETYKDTLIEHFEVLDKNSAMICLFPLKFRP